MSRPGDLEGIVLRTADNAVSGKRLGRVCALLVLLEILLVPADSGGVSLLMALVTLAGSAAIYGFYVRPELRIGRDGIVVV